MNDQSEEKTLPASAKKLQDARVKRGQVAHSKDLVAGISLLVTLGFLFLAWPSIRDRVLQLLDAVIVATGEPFAQASQRVIWLAFDALFTTSAALAAVILVTVVASGIAANGGPVFSFELLTPKLQNISPAQGAKRIFSLRSLVEFAKGLVKVVVLMAAFWLAVRGWLQSLFQLPACGPTCVVPTTFATLRTLAAVAAIAFVVIGLIDVLIQRRLFLRDMRMTRTEYKREQKDLEGDPLIRGERRRIYRRLAASGARTGLRHAVVAVAHGDHIVGLRYRPGETPVPVVVSKGRGELGERMRGEAGELGIPIIDDAELTAILAERHAVGDMIRREFFGRVAAVLVKAGRM